MGVRLPTEMLWLVSAVIHQYKVSNQPPLYNLPWDMIGTLL
uniref:Uncharacterized protein n=1 Tax=Setaria italica TaxID=4555 RepID=K3ZP62_SETIT